MGATNEMISANVRNWLQDLAIGAKAVNTKMMCGVAEEGYEWRFQAETYENVFHDGIITVHVHNIGRVAEAAEFDLQHRDFTPADDYYCSFTGEDFFIFTSFHKKCDTMFSVFRLKTLYHTILEYASTF